MTIARAYPAGWGVGEKLTSAQQNQVDLNTTSALDKRSGQTDTLESIVSAAGAGRLVPTVEVGANADTTYLLSDGIGIIRIPTTITASRIYTLSNTAAVDGDSVFVTMETPATAYSVTVKDAGGTTLFVLGLGQEGYEATFTYKTSAGWKLTQGRRATLAVEAFTANATWVCPRNVKGGLVHGWGGGGGGMTGAASNSSTNAYWPGGGGGAGAEPCVVPVVLTPGSSYSIEIGAAGAAAGGAGGDTKFIGPGPVDMVVASGAGGGALATVGAGTGTTVYSLGGRPVNQSAYVWGTSGELAFTDATVNPSSFTMPMGASCGGVGGSKTNSGAGARCPGYPYAGGAAGTRGTDDSTYRGGGGGGGGGAGPGGAGGAGGNGGNGVNGFPGNAGSAGTAGAANSGAGGGGGGAAGCGSGGGSTGGASGAGGTGKLFLVYVIQGE